MKKIVFWDVFLGVLLIGALSQAFAESGSMNVYLPAIIVKSNSDEVGGGDDGGGDRDGGLKSTGNFLKDFKLAIAGLEPSRFSLSTVADRYNEMGYRATVCKQVSYYHLTGGPFDKVIVDGTIYDVLVIEQTPKRWNPGPFSVDNIGQCI
jgi:hypothetical protein